jgi:hypothetical protein
MVRIALAPTSPFSVTGELMAETAELARARGVRLHTHLAETDDEEEFCRERFGMRPLEYLESLGWLGGDVWLAHCVHLDADETRRMGATGTGVAHCPTSNGRLGAGIAPVAGVRRRARRQARHPALRAVADRPVPAGAAGRVPALQGRLARRVLGGAVEQLVRAAGALGVARELVEARGGLRRLHPVAEPDREAVDRQPGDRLLDVLVGMEAAQLIDGERLRVRLHEFTNEHPLHGIWFHAMEVTCRGAIAL